VIDAACLWTSTKCLTVGPLEGSLQRRLTAAVGNRYGAGTEALDDYESERFTQSTAERTFRVGLLVCLQGVRKDA